MATISESPTVPALYPYGSFLVCPNCRCELRSEEGCLRCCGCSQCYEVRDNIPILRTVPEDDVQRSYIDSYENLASVDLQTPIVPEKTPTHSVLLKFIGDVRNRKVLDIGSSQGLYLQAMDAGFKVGLDISFNYARALPKRPDMMAVCADAEQLPVRPGFFDVIILSDILEHVLNPERLVAGLARVVTPSTRVIVHVPWEEDLAPYADSEFEYTHLRSFNSYAMFLLFRNFKLQKRRCTYPSLDSPLIFRLERYLPRFLVNLYSVWYFSNGQSARELAVRARRMERLPKSEWWLLKFYRCKFRIFEFRMSRRK